MKIVILEESMLVRCKLIKLLLSAIPGLNTSCFSGSRESIMKHIKEIGPDIILLDLDLNQYTGIYILKEIKEVLPHIKVIILSGLPFQEYRMKCIEAGADYFLDMTFDIDKIINIVLSMDFNSMRNDECMITANV